MLGSVLAVLNAEATAGPSTVRMRIIRMKPVMRLARLATAIEPVDRMSEASEESRVRPPIPPPGGSVASDPVPTGGPRAVAAPRSRRGRRSRRSEAGRTDGRAACCCPPRDVGSGGRGPACAGRSRRRPDRRSRSVPFIRGIEDSPTVAQCSGDPRGRGRVPPRRARTPGPPDSRRSAPTARPARQRPAVGTGEGERHGATLTAPGLGLGGRLERPRPGRGSWTAPTGSTCRSAGAVTSTLTRIGKGSPLRMTSSSGLLGLAMVNTLPGGSRSTRASDASTVSRSRSRRCTIRIRAAVPVPDSTVTPSPSARRPVSEMARSASPVSGSR